MALSIWDEIYLWHKDVELNPMIFSLSQTTTSDFLEDMGRLSPIDVKSQNFADI